MKQVFKLVNLFLVVLLLSFTSCTNDLSEKNPEISFSFTLPQETISSRSTEENSDFSQWIINAQIETSEKVLQNITQEGTSGQTITIHFENIQVSQNVRIDIELTPKGEEKPSYKGTSEWFITKKGSNKIHITLKKIQYEIIPDDDNDTGTDDKPEIIIDAAVPQINVYPTSKVEIATENNSQEELTETLSVNATSTDGGTLSFIWQEKNSDGNWENITDYTTSTTNGQTSCSIDVTVNKGKSRTFKCIITNTNNSVNGNKTATIETNEVTVAYVEGQLASIKAQYIGEYEKFNYEDFYSNGKVTVTETYTNGNTPTEVKVTADESRYTISPTNNDEKAIGYVPYTVSCISSTNITTNLTVPVKYQLNANAFVITGSNQNNGNQEKIAQFTGNTTLEVVTSEASNVPSKIYENKDENSATAEDYDILQNLQSVWKLENQQIIDTTVNNAVAKTYQYTNTLTVPTENSWCVGDPIELEYEVEVCPWKIALNTEDGNTVDLNILTGNTTYTLSATNEAVANPNVTWESSDSSVFNVRGSTLTTPTANANDQIATITAKVSDVQVASVTVTVPSSAKGSENNPITTWSELDSAVEAGGTIYIKNGMTATSTITVSTSTQIVAKEDVTITRGSGFTKAFFENTSIFTLGDSDGTNKITLDGGKGSNIDAQAPLITSRGESAELTLNNCILQNNKNTSDTKGGAINISSGTFTMNGGVVGKEVTENVGPTEIQSWECAADASNFSNYAKAGGGGIYIASGTATINDAKISYNYTLDKSTSEIAHGGGIYIEEGSLTLENTEVSYNRGYQGAGVKCYSENKNAGTVILKQATIKGNAGKVSSWNNFGGGVVIKNFTLVCDTSTQTSIIEENYSGDGGALFLECTESTLQNITIQNNAYNGYQQGTEVLLYDQANMSIGSGDVIIKNEDANDRGVYVRNSSNALKLSGAAKLDTPIYLEKGAMVTVAGELSGDDVATITPAEYEVGTQVLTAENYVTLANYVGKFAVKPDADGTNYTIDSDGKLVAESSTGGSSGGTITANIQVSTWSNLKTEIASITGTTYTEENPYVIEITGNINTEDSTVEVITVSSHVKLVSNSDCTITRTSAFASVNLFQVNSEASLTIGDENAGGTLTLDGGETEVSATASLINVSGTLVLNEKSVLQNNNCPDDYNSTNGSAVYSSGGNIQIHGGIIKNNSILRKEKSGGGIYLENGTFTMTKGNFIDNSASTSNGNNIYGGALYINSCTVSISNANFVSNYVSASNTECYGGAIYIINSGTETSPVAITNCTFTNNKAYQKGAAIYTGGASYIEITSCNFTENTVTNTDSTTGTGTGEQSDVYIGNNSGWTKIDGTECSKAWNSN